MECELGEVRFDRALMNLLDHPGSAPVEPCTRRRRQLVVERLAYDIVREAVPTERPGDRQ